MEKLLSVNNLCVDFPTSEGDVLAVRDVSFSIEKGKTLGLVGESGCGKTVTAYSILRLLASPGRISAGRIIFNGQDLIDLDQNEIRSIRGKEISMIFQEPMSSLNPVFTIGYQISEILQLHLGMPQKDARDRTVELLRLVGIPSPEKRISSYPHEFSGGMRQRVMIAMALATSPKLLIADEPTTALDVTIQAQILDLLLNVQQDLGMSLLLITHDLGVVANIADDIAIMYAGEIVEYGKAADIFSDPLHPYTIGLFRAIPKIGSNSSELKTIPGMVPTIMKQPDSCVFYPRCYAAAIECTERKIDFFNSDDGRSARCVRIGKQKPAE